MQNFCFQSQITLLKVEDFAYSSRKQRWNSQRKSWRRLRSSLITITNQKEKGPWIRISSATLVYQWFEQIQE